MTDKDTFIQNIIDSEIEYTWKLKRIAEINDTSDSESIELQRQIDSDNATFAMWMEMYNITREEIDAVREGRLLERQQEIADMDKERESAAQDSKDNTNTLIDPNPLAAVIPELLESDTITTV